MNEDKILLTLADHGERFEKIEKKLAKLDLLDGVLKTQDNILKTQDNILKTQDNILKTQDNFSKTQDGILKTQDKMLCKLLDVEEKLGNKLDKDDFAKFLEKYYTDQDQMMRILIRLDQERIFTNENIKQLENRFR